MKRRFDVVRARIALVLLLGVAIGTPSVSFASDSCAEIMSGRSKEEHIRRLEALMGQETVARLQSMGLRASVLIEAHRFAAETMRRYPPDRYHVLHLGLPSILISAMMRAMRPDLEGSYFSELPIMNGYFDLGKNEHRAEWFRRALPQLQNLGGRELVVTRGVWQTQQLSMIGPALIEYLHQNQLTSRVHFNLVTNSAHPAETMSERVKSLFGRRAEPSSGLPYVVNATANNELNSALVFRRDAPQGDPGEFLGPNPQSIYTYPDGTTVRIPFENDYHLMSRMRPFMSRDVLTRYFRWQENPESSHLAEVIERYFVAVRAMMSP